MVSSRRAFLALFVSLCAVLFPAIASAANVDFRVLFDVDRDPATGCTVNGIGGIDQVLVTRVETLESTAEVTQTHRQVCSAGVLGAATDIDISGWSVGFNPSSGEVVVETKIPFSALSEGDVPRLRVAFDGTNGAAIHSAALAPNGDPILLPRARSGKRRSVGSPGSARVIVLDGLISDWTGLSPLLQGIAGGGSQALRIIKIYSFADTANDVLYFRFDALVSSNAPFANDDAYSRTQGSGLTVNAPGVLLNDGDPQGQPLTALPVSTPQHGDVTLNPDGSFTYAPQNPTSTQNDSFEYKATNGDKESNVAKVSITVSSVLNQPPVAQSDSFPGTEDTPLTIGSPGVLSNDNDPEGQPLTATLVTPPAHGGVALAANGGFTYSPALNYFGGDSFTYTISDGTNSATATVTINVAAVNDAPKLQGQIFTLPENSIPGTIVGDVVATDVDSGGLTYSLTAGGATFSIDPFSGRVVVINGGTLDFESSPTADFTVLVEDDGSPGASDIDPFTVFLENINDRPTVQSQAVATNEDTALPVTLPANDQDGNPLTFTVLAGPFHGTLTGSAPNLTYTPDQDYYGSDSIIFLANDADLDSASGTISITVNPVNDAPVGAVDVYATMPGVGFTISPGLGVLANDFDAEGDALVAEIVTTPANGSIVFNDDGSFTYVPNPIFTGIDTFVYRVVEATSGASSVVLLSAGVPGIVMPHAGETTVSINVHASNVPPTGNPQNLGTPEDTSLLITLTGNDGDGDAIAFDIASPPAHGVLNGTNPNVLYVPNDDYNGPDSFTFTVTDGFSTSSPATISITVAPVNDDPDSTVDVYGVVTGGTLNVTAANGVLANDSDIDGDSLDAALDANVGHGTLALNPADGSFTYTPTFGFVGTDSFFYRAYDGVAYSNVTKVTLNVRIDNQVPAATAQSVTLNEDAVVGITLTGSDADGDAVSFSIATNPSQGVLAGAPPNVTYTPNANYNGADSFTFTASDGFSTSAPATVSINVLPINDPPVANDDSASTAEETPVSGAVLGNDTDVDGNSLTAVLEGSPAHGGIVLDPDGTFTYTPDANFTGTDVFSYRASDGVALSNIGQVAITVTAVNDPPSFNSGGDVTVNEDSGVYSAAWATAISAGPADESGQTLTFNITNNTNPSLFSIAPAIASNGTLTFTTAGDQNGSATITVTLSDNGGGSNTSAPQSFVINLTPVNDVPSFTAGADQTVAEDAGAQTVAGWATAISEGPANESSQNVSFAIDTNSDASLFQVLPAVAPDGTLTYTPAADKNGPATITLHIIDDGGTAGGGVDASATQSFMITINAVNDPPAFSLPADHTSNEDAGAQSVPNFASSISVGPSDESAQSITSFNVSNDNNSLFQVQPQIATNGTLTYTALADANGTATVTVTATDSGGATSSPAQTFDIIVSPINDEPAFNIAADPPAVNEDALAQTVNNFASSISKGPGDESGQNLTFTVTLTGSTGGLTFATNPAIDATGTLTYEATGNANGTAMFDVVLTDNGASAPPPNDNTSATDSFTITVNAVNDAPVVIAGNTHAYQENDPAITLENALTITDIDSTMLQSAVVSISGNFAAGDTLACPACGGTITAIWNSGGGNLQLSGTDTIANYELALRSVTYVNGNDAPSGSQRSIDWFVTDSAALQSDNTAANDTLINFTTVNDGPQNSVPGAQTTDEDTPLAFTGGNAITVSDADSGTSDVQVTLAATNGTITLNGAGLAALTGHTGNNTASITMTGTVAEVNAAMDGMTFNPAFNTNTAGTLAITTSDQGNTGAIGGTLSDGPDSVTININPVNDNPVVTTTVGVTTFTEGDPAEVVDSGVTVTDVDSLTLTQVTVTITNLIDTGDEILDANVGATGIVKSYVAPTLTLSHAGAPLADFQAVMQTVTYENTSGSPDATQRVIRFVANDGSILNSLSANADKNLDVVSINSQPVVTASGGTTAFIEDSGAVTIDTGVTVSDPDNTTLAEATVTIVSPPDGAAEVLAAPTLAGDITASWSSPTLTLTSTGGAASHADFQTVLQAVTYNNSDDTPTTTNRTIQFQVDDGDVSNNLSAVSTQTVSVAASNDPPVVTTTVGNSTFTEGSGAVVVDGAVTVFDPDTSISGATITITNIQDAGMETLSANVGATGIVANYSAPTLTLSNIASVADYQQVLQSITYENTKCSPTTGTARTINFQVTDTAAAPSNVASKVVNVVPVNVPAAVTADPQNTTVCEGTLASFTATASGTPAPTVQWQVDPDGSGFVDIPLATNTTYSFTALAADTNNKYRAVFTNACNTVTTNFATLTVNTTPVVTDDPDDTTVQSGSLASFTAAASGSPAPSVQWEVSTNGGGIWSPIGSATNTTYSFTAALADDANQYRAVFTNVCGTDTSAVATLTVTCPPITVTRNGGGVFPPGIFNTAYTGESVTASGGTGPYDFTVTAGGLPTNLSLALNGTISGTPSQTGTFNFTVTATDTATGCTGVQAFSIAINPVADNDTYSNLVNNTQALVTGGSTSSPSTPFVALSGDLESDDLPSGGVSIVAGTFSSANGTNNVVIAADGTFLYTPPVTASALATDSFTYTITSNTGGTGTPAQATGTVTLNLANRVWYIRNNAASGGNGQSQAPFDSITIFNTNATDAAGDIIYVYFGDGTTTDYNAPLTLLNNQQLIGEGVALVVNTNALVGAGSKPLITNTAGDIVTLGDGNTVRGLTLTGASANDILGNGKAGFTGDTLTIQNAGIASSAVTLTGMTGTVTLTNTAISNSAFGLKIDGGTAIVNVDNTNTINSSSGQRTVHILNRAVGSGAITIGAGITDNGAGMLIENNTGGTFNFTGTVSTNTPASNGVALSLNAAAAVTTFSGTLTIGDAPAGGLVGTGGTLNITGASNTASTGTGTAISLSNTTIGPSGVTFLSVSNASAVSGILLSNTGAGLFSVTGNGVTAGTGGTISNSSGSAVSMTNTPGGVSLACLTITGANIGIAGNTFGTLTIGTQVNVSGASGLALQTGAISGMFNNVTATNGNVSLTGITGTWGATAGSITGNASAPAFNVSGGSSNITWGPSVSQALANTVVTIASTNTGIINFNGSVNSTGSSTGLSISASSGTYNFNAANQFSGVNGITIGPSQSGNVSFSANTTNTSGGTSFNVNGATGAVTAAITYSGTINKASGGIMVNVDNLDSPGTLTMTHAPAAAGDLTQSAGATAAGISVINSNSTNITISNASVTFQSIAAGFTASGNTGATINLPGLALTGSGDKAGMLISGGGTINVNAGAGNPSINLSGGTAAASRAIDGTTVAFSGTLNLTNVTISGNAIADIVTLGGGTLGGNGSTISGANDALVLNGVALTNGAGMTSINSSGGANGISLTSVTGGTYTVGSGGNLSGNTGTAFNVSGGSPTFSYAGNITQNTASQRAVNIATLAGGTITLSGAIGSTGGTGVSIAGTGGTVTISGALTLSGAASVFLACNGTCAAPSGTGLTVNVTNANNTIGSPTAAAATAININRATIGASGVQFRTVNVNTASNGITLSNTGSSGGSFQIVGTGSAGSGGTIQNITNRGASFISGQNIVLNWMNFTSANTSDGALSDGTVGGNENTDENGAIHLSSVVNANLSNINISGTTAQHGINGNNVTNLDLTDVSINNPGDEVWESGIYLFHLKGTGGSANVWDNVDITDTGQFNVSIINASGTNASPGAKDLLTIQNGSTFSNSGKSVIGDHISIFNSVTANFEVSVQSATITSKVGGEYAGAHTSDGIQFDVSGASTAGKATVNNCNFGGGGAGQSAINISATTGTGTFELTNNIATVRQGVGINIAVTGSASLSGLISDNNLSTNITNSPASGINIVEEGNGSIVAHLEDNIIQGTDGSTRFDYGIRGGARAGNGNAHLTLKNNTVQSAKSAGTWLFAGNGTAGESTRTCVNFSTGNTIDGDPVTYFADYFLEQYTGTTFNIQGLVGSGTNAANVAAYVAGTDLDPAAGDPLVSVDLGTVVNYSNASCTTYP